MNSVCDNIWVFYGAPVGGTAGPTVINNVVDFADSDWGNLLCSGSCWNTSYNVFRYTASNLPYIHTWHDNLFEYFFENGHSNVIESKDGEIASSVVATTNAIYNNVFRHIEQIANGGGVNLWFGPQTGVTDYIFDNVEYDVGDVE